jgi:hypothetical protein
MFGTKRFTIQSGLWCCSDCGHKFDPDITGVRCSGCGEIFCPACLGENKPIPFCRFGPSQLSDEGRVIKGMIRRCSTATKHYKQHLNIDFPRVP